MQLNHLGMFSKFWSVEDETQSLIYFEASQVIPVGNTGIQCGNHWPMSFSDPVYVNKACELQPSVSKFPFPHSSPIFGLTAKVQVHSLYFMHIYCFVSKTFLKASSLL